MPVGGIRIRFKIRPDVPVYMSRQVARPLSHVMNRTA